MSRFLSDSPEAKRPPPRPGVLLLNLGTPDAPTRAAVRAYLKEFLSDPRVVEIPRFVWWPILYLFVLTTRPKASARRYGQIWGRDGSPLRVYTERQARLLHGYLGDRFRMPVEVDYAMRYGQPGIRDKVLALKERGCDRILLLPLYPQYSASTTATAFDKAFGLLAQMRTQPEIRTIRDFHDDPGYIRALTHTIEDYWSKRGRPQVLVMSFHGVPQRTVALGDPYHQQCERSGRLVAESLGLTDDQYRITFQSRFGPAQWLRPYTAEVLSELGRRNVERVDVVCPGFVCDCLETLEEIALEGKELFTSAGGREFHYIPCLNDRHVWISALADLAERHLAGWLPAPAAAAEQRADFARPTGTHRF